MGRDVAKTFWEQTGVSHSVGSEARHRSCTGVDNREEIFPRADWGLRAYPAGEGTWPLPKLFWIIKGFG